MTEKSLTILSRYVKLVQKMDLPVHERTERIQLAKELLRKWERHEYKIY